MSLWADYITELLGGQRKFIEHDWGFVAYEFPVWAPECVMVNELYVVPEQRKSGKGRDLFAAVEQLGREAGKKSIIAQLELATAVYAESLAAQLAVGLVPVSAENGKILMRKVIT